MSATRSKQEKDGRVPRHDFLIDLTSFLKRDKSVKMAYPYGEGNRSGRHGNGDSRSLQISPASCVPTRNMYIAFCKEYVRL